MAEELLPKREFTQSIHKSSIQDQLETETAYMESNQLKAQAEVERVANSTTAIDTIVEGLVTGNKVDSMQGNLLTLSEVKRISEEYAEEYGGDEFAPTVPKKKAEELLGIEVDGDVSPRQLASMYVIQQERKQEDEYEKTTPTLGRKALGTIARMVGATATIPDMLMIWASGGAVRLASPAIKAAAQRGLIAQSKGIRKLTRATSRIPVANKVITRQTSNKIVQSQIKFGRRLGKEIERTSKFTKLSTAAGTENVLEQMVIDHTRKLSDLPVMQGLTPYAMAFFAPSILVGSGLGLSKLMVPAKRQLQQLSKRSDVKNDMPNVTEIADNGLDEIADDIRATIEDYRSLDVEIDEVKFKELYPWANDEKVLLTRLQESGQFTPAQLNTKASALAALREMDGSQKQIVNDELLRINEDDLVRPFDELDTERSHTMNRENAAKDAGSSETKFTPEQLMEGNIADAARLNAGKGVASKNPIEKPKVETTAKEGEAKVEEPEVKPLNELTGAEQKSAIKSVAKEMSAALTNFIKCRGG